MAAEPELIRARTSPGDWPDGGLGDGVPVADGGGGGGIGEEGAVTAPTIDTARTTNKAFFVRYSAKVIANSS
ncbi:hypothetical protein GCM10009802_30660 [Streptomyces synnematoformans]|uniref:Uncharacterized protein n=1 Tax=Streptomyces synnematoformans TaxID=415721 RepID=A0ABN2YFN2_9ACTN